MVNINVPLPDELHRRVKLEAVQRGKTVKEHIIERLDEGLRKVGR